MYEYELINKYSNEHWFIFGYSISDAWRRNAKLNPTDWSVIHCEYID